MKFRHGIYLKHKIDIKLGIKEKLNSIYSIIKNYHVLRLIIDFIYIKIKTNMLS